MSNSSRSTSETLLSEKNAFECGLAELLGDCEEEPEVLFSDGGTWKPFDEATEGDKEAKMSEVEETEWRCCDRYSCEGARWFWSNGAKIELVKKFGSSKDAMMVDSE